MFRTLVLLLALAAQQLPATFHSPWFRKGTRVVAMPDGHRLTVPAGFAVNLFAEKLEFARFMALAPNGDVFLADPVRGAGKITILRDADKDGVAETRETFATGLNRPFGVAFWKKYRHSAFVALHGSINRSTLSGYRVVGVPFRNGRPAGPPEDFLSGFIARDDEEKQAWGRPVGLLQMPDGSLLVSDDGGNRVWRVSYGQKK